MCLSARDTVPAPGRGHFDRLPCHPALALTLRMARALNPPREYKSRRSWSTDASACKCKVSVTLHVYATRQSPCLSDSPLSGVSQRIATSLSVCFTRRGSNWVLHRRIAAAVAPPPPRQHRRPFRAAAGRQERSRRAMPASNSDIVVTDR